MINLKAKVSAILIFAGALSAASCGKSNDSTDVDLSTSSNGIILRSNIQTCLDKSNTGTGTITYSASGPALYISDFKLTWKSKDSDLLVATLLVTVTSNQLAGGSVKKTIDSSEIEALLGAPGAIIKRATSDSPSPHDSLSTSKGITSTGTALVPCGLAVGGLSLASANASQFTANVQIDLIGTAQDDNNNYKTILKTIYTTATYY